MRWKLIVAAAAVMTMVLGGYVGAAGAVTETRPVVKAQLRDGYDTNTPEDGYAHPFLWYREDTRTGGGVGLTNPDRTDEPCVGAPEGFGNQALALTTNNSGAAKAQLINHADEVAGTLLSTVNELSYWTYQCTGTGSATDNASYQLQVDLDGDLATTTDRTNLVYETYWNDTEGSAPQQALVQGVWQHWVATEGDWWTSKQITCGDYSLAPGGGGPPFDQPQDVGEACPSAVVYGVGVNIGSGNPNHIVAVDGLTFGSTADTITWDFGPAPK